MKIVHYCLCNNLYVRNKVPIILGIIFLIARMDDSNDAWLWFYDVVIRQHSAIDCCNKHDRRLRLLAITLIFSLYLFSLHKTYTYNIWSKFYEPTFWSDINYTCVDVWVISFVYLYVKYYMMFNNNCCDWICVTILL